ncbi:glycosyltransferase [Allocoprobacillus halotolerans]|uniref:Glycosyltransferase n=1 Tax=Allocoprobacillus halotolerans TaxID=2944914 RepID=A0ABY5I2B4_9FIRM|nr:glycosyltransferase [Allocoprobacillus halotolerans]UTY38132.1 glycosyltransferase [Allocoprobacillus halotolerans]
MIESLKRLEKCFQYVTISGYHLNGEVFFSHLHSDQYTQFLYFFANTAWKNGLDETFSQKLMNLIRYISGMFVSYKCKLPDIFIFYHAVGSVIGNADYSDFLVVFQNVTINTGNSVNGELVPKIGKGCFLAAGAKIIGNKTIGDRVSIGVNALIYNESVLSDTIVICLDGKSVIKKDIKKNVWHKITFLWKYRRKYQMKKTIGFCIPCYNEEKNILKLYNAIKENTYKFNDYEFIYLFIDNYSTDKTRDILKDLAKDDKNVKIIFNTKNFGPARSGAFGFYNTPGDAVITMACDLQDPPELISSFIKKWEEGNKLILGRKVSSEEKRLMFFSENFIIK